MLYFSQREQQPVIYVFNAVTGETLPIPATEAQLSMSVARLKTVVSIQSGLPISTFRLSSPAGEQLYDCHQLQDYITEVGTVCFCLHSYVTDAVTHLKLNNRFS